MPAETNRVRVLVADDHPVYREGIVEALRRAEDFEVIAQCTRGDEALERIRDLKPAVAVLDNRMPGMTAEDVLAALGAEPSDVRALVLSAHVDGRYVARVLELGAAGYLSKESDRATIVEAVRRIAAGGTVIGADVQAGLVEHMATGRDRSPLSPREREVLALLADGLSSVEIAQRLVLSPTTIKTHLSNLYEKLGVSDRAAAVAEAMRRGLLR